VSEALGVMRAGIRPSHAVSGSGGRVIRRQTRATAVGTKKSRQMLSQHPWRQQKLRNSPRALTQSRSTVNVEMGKWNETEGLKARERRALAHLGVPPVQKNSEGLTSPNGARAVAQQSPRHQLGM
jgi:hypothetical protein